ncbi:MAG: hypothetical protein ACRCTY_03020, partial [Candidatus Adiutrix sp.]
MYSFKLNLFAGLLFMLTLAAAPALAAGSLDSVFQKAQDAPWGAKQAEVKKKTSVAPVLAEKKIMIVADSGLAAQSTLNYLFNEKTGQLYNLAWYAATPTTKIKDVLALEKALEKGIKAKLGKPLVSRTDGNPSGAKGVKKVMAARAKANEILDKAKKDKGADLTGKEMLVLLQEEGISLMTIIPTLFYSKLNFWDGGEVWVTSNLLCSND